MWWNMTVSEIGSTLVKPTNTSSPVRLMERGTDPFRDAVIKTKQFVWSTIHSLVFHRSILVQGQAFAGNIFRLKFSTFMVRIRQLSFWSNVKLLSDQFAQGNQGTVTNRPEILRWYAKIFYTLDHNKSQFCHAREKYGTLRRYHSARNEKL